MPREYLFCSVLSWWNIKNRAVFTSQFSLCSEISVMLWITMMTNLVNELHLYIYEFIRLSTWEYKGTGILSHMYVSLLDSLTWLIINFGLNFILLSQIWPWNFNPTSRGRWHPKKKTLWNPVHWSSIFTPDTCHLIIEQHSHLAPHWDASCHR